SNIKLDVRRLWIEPSRFLVRVEGRIEPPFRRMNRADIIDNRAEPRIDSQTFLEIGQRLIVQTILETIGRDQKIRLQPRSRTAVILPGEKQGQRRALTLCPRKSAKIFADPFPLRHSSIDLYQIALAVYQQREWDTDIAPPCEK